MSSILATLSAQDESSCALVQDTLASVGKLEALWQSQEEKHRKMLLLEQEKKLLLEKEASTAAHNDQLLQTLTARVSKEKSMARECNAQQQRNEELDRELNQTLAKCANLQRDLDEKISELTREEMRRKTEVDDATKAGREEMDRALHTLRQEKALELKTLEDLHSKKLAMLKREYDEKMILFSASAPTRAPPACITVSEAQLKQSLQEARCEIEVLKDKLKMKDVQAQSVAGPSTELAAGETPRRRKYFISSDSDSEDTIFGSSKNGARAPSSNSVAKTQRKASQLQQCEEQPKSRKAPRAKSKTTVPANQTTLKHRREGGKATLKLAPSIDRDPFDYL